MAKTLGQTTRVEMTVQSMAWKRSPSPGKFKKTLNALEVMATISRGILFYFILYGGTMTAFIY
jgi:hypothetical protein